MTTLNLTFMPSLSIWINNIHQSGRGGLGPQDNRQTASGQSADWSINCSNYPIQPPTSINNIHQSDRGGLWLQDNRQTGDNHPEHPIRAPTSIIRFNQPPRNNHFQSDRGGLHSFRTIGRLVNQSSINHFDQ
ncbi:hypothetical protein PENSOL_c042G08493 [Penicillium solitum]|uniref:Uncharacterized protein n=1 Tax=Penicillium solitum TaxID=60172 RepID=A0A1V6QTU8_9EURO|nr:uncharacterized protein PENSOL_c042G08493 [Penicillium solitum]OQD92382.1 hypothetical protein PENSOL_c042G08493 [Penicillium solitum]